MNTLSHASRKVGPLQAVSAYQEWILIESIYIDTGFLLISWKLGLSKTPCRFPNEISALEFQPISVEVRIGISIDIN
jgi:hypothetical protein